MAHPTTGSFAIIASLLVSSPPGGTTAAIGDMPIKLHQHHLVVAKGSIGPLNDLNLLIDTGTIPSMVDIRIGRKLHLQAQPSALVAFGQQIRVQSAVIDGFRLGSLQSGPLPVGVGDLSYLEGVRIDAIVGLDVLSGTNFSIDYHSRVLKFAPDTRENAVARLEVVWPFVTVRMAISDEPVRLLVDTGSSDLVLFKTQLPAAISRGPWGGEKTVRYASGAARLQRVELQQVELGTETWDKLPAWALDKTPEGYPPGIDGVLGVLALGCRRVHFDFQGRQLRWSL